MSVVVRVMQTADISRESDNLMNNKRIKYFFFVLMVNVVLQLAPIENFFNPKTETHQNALSQTSDICGIKFALKQSDVPGKSLAFIETAHAISSNIFQLKLVNGCGGEPNDVHCPSESTISFKSQGDLISRFITESFSGLSPPFDCFHS